MGNYSFLQFTYSGSKYNIGLNILISYLRFPLTFLPIFLMFSISRKSRIKLVYFLNRNIDIVLFVLFGVVGLINFPFYINGYIYTLLFGASLILILLYIFFISEYKKDFESFYILSKMLVISHGILLLLGLISLSTFDFITRSNLHFFTLKFGDVLFFSNPIFIIALSLGYIYIYQRRRLYRFATTISKLSYFRMISICLTFIFVCLLLFISNRRTPLILLGCIIPFIFYFSVKSRFLKYMLLLLIPISFIYVAAMIPKYLEENRNQSKLLNRLDRIEIKDGNVDDASLEIRLHIWKSYLQVFNKYPLIGVGYGNLVPVHNSSISPGNSIRNKSPHNTFLGLLVSNGIFGALLFAFITIRSMTIFLIRSKGVFKYYYSLVLVCILIMNYLEFNLYPGQSLFWPTFIILLFPRIYLNKYLIK